MKTQNILPILLALGIAATATLASAEGLTYDPYENYYSKYYGIEAELITAQTADTLPEVSPEAKIVTHLDDADMANPLNYYKW